MTLGQDTSKRIDELLFKKDWSLYRLSKTACIPLSTLKNLYVNHTKSPSLALIFKLASAFEMSVVDFLNSPFFQEQELEIY